MAELCRHTSWGGLHICSVLVLFLLAVVYVPAFGSLLLVHEERDEDDELRDGYLEQFLFIEESSV